MSEVTLEVDRDSRGTVRVCLMDGDTGARIAGPKGSPVSGSTQILTEVVDYEMANSLVKYGLIVLKRLAYRERLRQLGHDPEQILDGKVKKETKE